MTKGYNTMSSAPASPKKDVIYVDIEDDITSIIDKVKHASAAIVALVPPKRIGALQSVVNLKLLQRAAESSKKRVVMITNDTALAALAAGVAMPVAKNLQSKPEIAEIAALQVDDDDVIDGETAADDVAGATVSDASALAEPVAASSAASSAASKLAAIPRRRGASVPNFNSFRNKMIIGGGGAVLLIAFFVWAIVFAPHASITITAKTTPYGVNKIITATVGGQLSAADGSLAAITKEVKKTASVDFQATGKKDVGEKATGVVQMSNSGDSDPVVVAAGTTLSSASGLDYTTDAAVTIPGAKLSGGKIVPGTASGAVTASASGSKYNAASGNLTGMPAGSAATLSAPTSGGTDKTITIVTEQDAASARDKVAAQDSSTVKAELKKQFAADTIVVEESFVVTPGAPSVAPAVGQEATTAKVSVETSYTIVGLARSDVRAIVEKDLTRQIAGLPNQSIYDQGIDTIKFAGFSQQGSTYKLNLITTGYVGPSIDSVALAKKLVGKREGEIQQIIKTYEGVKSVDVRFSPFWVSTAPSSDKTTIKFQIDNAKN